MNVNLLVVTIALCATLCFGAKKDDAKKDDAKKDDFVDSMKEYFGGLLAKDMAAIKRGIPCRCGNLSSAPLNGQQSYVGGDCGDGWKVCRWVNPIFNCCERA